METVIQDGKVVVFDEEKIARSWPHDRGITYSVGDLTYDVVHGDAAGTLALAVPPTLIPPMTARSPAAMKRATWSRPWPGGSSPLRLD